MPLEQKWPQTLWIVRHGQSAGNVARDAAESARLHLIDIAERDVDVPLSRLGEQQADALGRWFAALPADERLREKEFGILDRMTTFGIREKYPELAEQRKHVGKFYFRPPGGESWCDVILRLRSFLDMLTREYRGERVLVVGHQVIVNCMRYLLERLDENQILAIDRLADVPNCGITSYVFDPRAGRHGKLVLQLENFVSPLRDAGAPVTAEPDRPAAPKS